MNQDTEVAALEAQAAGSTVAPGSEGALDGEPAAEGTTQNATASRRRRRRGGRGRGRGGTGSAGAARDGSNADASEADAGTSAVDADAADPPHRGEALRPAEPRRRRAPAKGSPQRAEDDVAVQDAPTRAGPTAGAEKPARPASDEVGPTTAARRRRREAPPGEWNTAALTAFWARAAGRSNSWKA